jgi:hypothetical protein
VSSGAVSDGSDGSTARRQSEFSLSRIQIAGLAISVIVPLALFAFGRSEDLVGNTVLGVALAILTQLIEIQIRSIKRDEDVKSVLISGLDEMRTANDIGRLLGRVPDASTAVSKLARDLVSIPSDPLVPMREIGLGRLADCARDIHSLSEGYIRVPLNDKNSAVASGLYRKAQQSLEATSVGSLAYWKTSRFAQKYLADTELLAQAGVVVDRVFIATREDLANHQDVLQKHLAHGVRVWTAVTGEVPNELVEDYLIIDGRVYTRREFSNSGRAVREYLTVDVDEIADARRRFAELRIYCEEFSG